MPRHLTDLTDLTALVLAAGGSSRLGRPKQLLPLGDATLLDATLSVVRSCGFGQVVVAIGGAADEVAATVDLSGVEVVRNPGFGAGCSSSIVAALPSVTSSAGLVLMLGDQPEVTVDAVRAVAAVDADLAVCRYRDGLGHPFRLGRGLFGELANLHGDKAVWKLVDAAGSSLVTVPIDADVPADVDTEADYEALLTRWDR